MTKDQKMQAIVEAAGECWHGSILNYVSCMTPLCEKCGTFEHLGNPSPSDLNELFRLAEKLNMSFALSRHGKRAGIYAVNVGEVSQIQGYSLAEALLEALYQAVKGE